METIYQSHMEASKLQTQSAHFLTSDFFYKLHKYRKKIYLFLQIGINNTEYFLSTKLLASSTGRNFSQNIIQKTHVQNCLKFYFKLQFLKKLIFNDSQKENFIHSFFPKT